MSSFGASRSSSLIGGALLLLVALVGCNDRSLSRGDRGYLASDLCAQRTAESTCTAEASGCLWVAAEATSSGAAPTGGCVANDPCLQLDQNGCKEDSGCAWSQLATLCPLGAACTDSGGFCHAKDPSGGDCVCVSPLSCPADGDCPAVECDCSGGGSGGSGGACSCACPACAPGEACPPCACSCDDGGPGCTQPGTCACACPACAPGETCPPCDCVCSSDGSTTVSGGGSTTVDPCSAHTDESACAADTSNACMYYAFGRPCIEGEPCVAGVCQTTKASADPSCDCACPSCPADTDCPPCTCACTGPSGGTMGDCVPPPTPTEPIACPAIGCFAPCPNGERLDAAGCPTCECL